jgi:hypothetical protein
MSVDPEHYRAARVALPRLPLPAILGFGVAGFGGALFLAYSTFSAPEATHSLASKSNVPVYEARAVPLDPKPEDVAARATSIARALTATPSESERSQTIGAERELEQSESELLPGADGELRGFSRFGNSGAANSYLAVTGTTFGMNAHMAPSGISASDAETAIFAPVPEASTWLCGAALLALVVARGLHASWYRHQRRSGSKSDSVH